MGLCLCSATLPAADRAFAPRYARIFMECQALYQRTPTNAEVAWQYARACFDRSEFATNRAQRAEFARLGIDVARASVALRPDLAATHYYLGLNLGVLADATRNLGGLKLVSEMEASFKKAAQIDPLFDYAGPDRCLGLLYRDAPGWPISAGSKSKARLHLEQARQLAREYPENQLIMLETWLKWGEKEKAVAELEKVDTVLAQARLKLTGESWGWSWSDWDRTWRRIRSKVTEGNRASSQHKPAK
jgi:hypothetical protein